MNEDPEITIRPATNADGERIKELVFGILAEYSLSPDPSGTDDDLNDIEGNYAARGGLFEVIENATGELLGTYGLYPMNTETVELRKMYFAKSLRGKGLGKRTLQRLIDETRRLGFRRIHLETASPLKAAIALYKSFGFQPTIEMHSSRCDQAYFLDLD